MSSCKIIAAIDNYSNLLKETVKSADVLPEIFTKKDPNKIREQYEPTMDLYCGKIREIEQSKQNLENCKKKLDECLNLIQQISDKFNDVGTIIKDKKTGTLQALCREAVSNNNIPVGEVEQTVIDMRYDENEAIKKLRAYIDCQIKSNAESTSGGKKPTRKNKRKYKMRTRRR
jgi:hypothetical protein